MPSSYTTSGVVLIADSEESGTWGQVTNTNLQIINRFASQAGSISLAGTTHTLNVSDGTLSDGHYGILVFGGTPSGTNTVTINPNDAQRIYMVKNDSGQSVIMSQGSGSTVTVADGAGAIIYCDGAGSGAAVVDMTATFGFQTYDAGLAAIAGLAVTDGNVIVGNGSTWVAESGNTVLASLGVTATATELNTMDGITSTTAELNLLDGVTWTLTDFNGLTATVAELNYVDGVTSNIQTQLDALDSGKENADAEILKADTDDNLTAGYTATADDDGTKSSGTYTPDPAGGNLKRIVNGGAFTLAAPTATGDYTIIIQMTNNASAGTVTLSGFAAETGDAMTTTNGDDFFLYITKINGFSAISITALQ